MATAKTWPVDELTFGELIADTPDGRQFCTWLKKFMHLRRITASEASRELGRDDHFVLRVLEGTERFNPTIISLSEMAECLDQSSFLSGPGKELAGFLSCIRNGIVPAARRSKVQS